MAMRKSFDRDLKQLKEKIFQMGHATEVALKKSYLAFEALDQALAEEVIEGDHFINRLEDEIEELIVMIITAQQPVASDLRKIMSAMKMTTSIERIADFAVDIAKATLRMGTEKHIKAFEYLPLMNDAVHKMLRVGLNAYMEDDVKLAQDMASMDDYVDQLYATVVKDVINQLIATPEKIEQAILLAYVARYYERIADHLTNIAEAIYYIVEGKRVDLNQ